MRTRIFQESLQQLLDQSWYIVVGSVVTIVVILGQLSPAYSADDAPTLLVLRREDGREQYRGFCTSVAPAKINCQFEGIRVVPSGDHTSTKRGERRTCGLFAQRWTIDFHRVSQNKWVNSPTPSGLCNITKVYQLERGSRELDWALIETPVSGDTDSPHCKGVDKELMKPTRWSWNGPAFYKLPCEYIDWQK